MNKNPIIINYDLIEKVLEGIQDLSEIGEYTQDQLDSKVRILRRQLAEAINLPLDSFKLLKEDEVKPLYNPNYIDYTI